MAVETGITVIEKRTGNGYRLNISATDSGANRSSHAFWLTRSKLEALVEQAQVALGNGTNESIDQHMLEA